MATAPSSVEVETAVDHATRKVRIRDSLDSPVHCRRSRSRSRTRSADVGPVMDRDRSLSPPATTSGLPQAPPPHQVRLAVAPDLITHLPPGSHEAPTPPSAERRDLSSTPTAAPPQTTTDGSPPPTAASEQPSPAEDTSKLASGPTRPFMLLERSRALFVHMQTVMVSIHQVLGLQDITHGFHIKPHHMFMLQAWLNLAKEFDVIYPGSAHDTSLVSAVILKDKLAFFSGMGYIHATIACMHASSINPSLLHFLPLHACLESITLQYRVNARVTRKFEGN
ncbi:hypothetical protein Tsubulata_026264 [Turnera subulata]|uniref:Uncharacterized protein n=1 Tax=Turnera subulata TaxID=218843 RepID=A0A9Q0FEZ5_9ROSI|nr:hypothetical protein Tsubulata_026264 [Turnera subulata]